MTVTVSDVDVSFGGVAALRNVSMKIPAGEVTALIGPNGAGKSTLVNCISGYAQPKTGIISVDGQNASGWPAHKRAAKGIARTFQTPRVQLKESLWENVMIGAYPHTHSSLVSTVFRVPAFRRREAHAAELAMKALDRFGLRENTETLAEDAPVWALRLMEVARALATQPKYLLLDEPAAGVDENARNQLATLVRGLAKEGIGVLVIEHHFGFVREVADNVVVLEQGQLLTQGSPAEIEKDQRVIDSYLGNVA
jgi:ABC-type branched-subunit amino acid transport system ATPase component